MRTEQSSAVLQNTWPQCCPVPTPTQATAEPQHLPFLPFHPDRQLPRNHDWSSDSCRCRGPSCRASGRGPGCPHYLSQPPRGPQPCSFLQCSRPAAVFCQGLGTAALFLLRTWALGTAAWACCSCPSVPRCHSRHSELILTLCTYEPRLPLTW